MKLSNLNKRLTKVLGFKVTLKNLYVIDDDIINVVLSVNNKSCYTKIIKLLKLLDIIDFNINVIYQYDIGYFNIDFITFYDDIDDVDVDVVVNDDINDDEIINKINIIDDVDDIDDDLKYFKYHQYKSYEINNKVIDVLNDDDINDIDDLNIEYLKFNKHLIKNMLLKRDIRGLDDLFNKHLTKNGHLKHQKHKKAVKKIKSVILDKYNTNTFKDEYLLKDYQYLCNLNNWYFLTYDDDVLKDEYNIKIFNGFNYNDVEYFKIPKNFKSCQYYINLLK